MSLPVFAQLLEERVEEARAALVSVALAGYVPRTLVTQFDEELRLYEVALATMRTHHGRWQLAQYIDGVLWRFVALQAQVLDVFPLALPSAVSVFLTCLDRCANTLHSVGVLLAQDLNATQLDRLVAHQVRRGVPAYNIYAYSEL